ncbi:uncharacterized protein LOC144106944 [Amblyomma americanum]
MYTLKILHWEKRQNVQPAKGETSKLEDVLGGYGSPSVNVQLLITEFGRALGNSSWQRCTTYWHLSSSVSGTGSLRPRAMVTVTGFVAKTRTTPAKKGEELKADDRG